MLRYKINTYPSKKIQQKHLYTLRTRNTLYGIHKESETDISKTSLVLFMEPKTAATFKRFLEKNQSNNISYNRALENDTVMYSTAIHNSSRMPLTIQKEVTRDIQMVCLVNYFDMLIVSKLEESDTVLDIFCYEYLFNSLPGRSMIEFTLRDLYEL